MAADNVGVDNAGAKELTGSVAHQWSPLLRPLVAGRTSIGVWGAAAASVDTREAVGHETMKAMRWCLHFHFENGQPCE